MTTASHLRSTFAKSWLSQGESVSWNKMKFEKYLLCKVYGCGCALQQCQSSQGWQHEVTEKAMHAHGEHTGLLCEEAVQRPQAEAYAALRYAT